VRPPQYSAVSIIHEIMRSRALETIVVPDVTKGFFNSEKQLFTMSAKVGNNFVGDYK
jgi:hypothetical protein